MMVPSSHAKKGGAKERKDTGRQTARCMGKKRFNFLFSKE